MEDVLGRAEKLLLNPRDTWSIIQEEEKSTQDVIREYVMILAFIPSLAGFGGLIFSGKNLFSALLWGALFYIFAIFGVWLTAKIINYLAWNFKIVHTKTIIFKLVAYSYTAIFVAGIFLIVPPFYWLISLGAYAFYILHIGISTVLECPAEDKLNFTILSIIVFIIIILGIFTLSGVLSGTNETFFLIDQTHGGA